MLAVAIVLHAWIAADAGLLFKRLKGFAAHLASLLLVGIWIFAAYAGVRMTALRNFAVGMSVIEIPYYNVRVGDCLLCRRLGDTEEVRPGDLVLIRYSNGRAVTQVIGLGGQRISVKGMQFLADGEPLDPERFPAENWNGNAADFQGDGAGTRRRLRKSEFLVRMRYSRNVRGYGSTLGARRTGREREGPLVVGRGQILARAFMRWMPLSRRGSLAENEDGE